MGLSAAEKNRRKRERKKKEKEDRRKQEEEDQQQHKNKITDEQSSNTTNKENNEEPEVEIEYVAEEPTFDLEGFVGATSSKEENDDANVGHGDVTSGLPPGLVGGLPGDNNEGRSSQQMLQQHQREEDNDIENVLRRFNERALVVPSVSAVVSDDDKKETASLDDRSSKDDDSNYDSDDDDDDDNENKNSISKRKMREMLRPTVADLKRRVARPDLVEAHDITAADPDFLIALKGIPGTAKVPRHWGRKRKYLQGKRGFEKPPFKLPDFIIKTGIAEIRDTIAEDEAKQSAKQKNRGRVNPKMGNMDVDYGVLYEAFFKYQTKPTNLTKFGDLYYEGKELETNTDIKPGGPYSKKLLEALAMAGNDAPPPWLFNMQRYGPPPSYPNLAIPGLNAPLPFGCTYGYHPGGFGKPPVDAYGRPLYGGNPFDPPGSGKKDDTVKELVTSDGKTVSKAEWGSLPTGEFTSGFDQNDDDESESEESSSDEDMDESDAEEEASVANDGIASVLPPPPTVSTTAPVDLRKQPAGDETPAPGEPPKRLYQVLETKAELEGSTQTGGVFQSDVRYVLPGNTEGAVAKAAPVPDGAESVLSKAMAPGQKSSRKRKHNIDDDDEALDKNFKF
ncbi:protein of unknown function DUF3582 containing protein [Nitzschia inconspicua]|uniref:PSP proline-rich domain-containing protein n=1 Tax=Nitzschia inconspicua TaxID=303405 RepID=A0A9K3KD14_9STRA|nr:protein of unknown function DUF3582 containing protein [Nitzschia inconspicua]